MPEKSRFAWTGAAKNRWVMVTFLLFAPASTKWLGSCKDNINICKPEEGWYGQPKYCYKKTIHVVMNQLCSSLWTSRLCFFFFYFTQHCVTSKKGLRGRLLVSLRNGWSKFTDLDIGVSLMSMEILCSFLRRPIRGENSDDGELNVGYFLTLKCRPLYLIMPFFLLWLSYCKFFPYCILITLVEY